MAIATNLISFGVAHALAEGNVIIGVGFGEVAAAAPNQLLRLLLPFKREVWDHPAFEDQVYVTTKANDSNTDGADGIRLDAQQFEYDPTTGQPILRLRIDLLAVPASIKVIVEAHHSTGR